MIIYHERQVGSYCRCHALNNLMGMGLVTREEFDKYCDEFDKLNGFEVGCSKKNCVFYNNGNTDNIFGYVLSKKGYNVTMKHYDFYSHKRMPQPSNKTIGYIVYNQQHTYCVRYIGTELFLIDSMKPTPRKIVGLGSISRRGTGVIEVFRK